MASALSSSSSSKFPFSLSSVLCESPEEMKGKRYVEKSREMKSKVECDSGAGAEEREGSCSRNSSALNGEVGRVDECGALCGRDEKGKRETELVWSCEDRRKKINTQPASQPITNVSVKFHSDTFMAVEAKPRLLLFSFVPNSRKLPQN